jgi:hypothetical protein
MIQDASFSERIELGESCLILSTMQAPPNSPSSLSPDSDDERRRIFHSATDFQRSSSDSPPNPPVCQPGDGSANRKSSRILPDIKKISAVTRVIQLTGDGGSNGVVPRMWTPFVLRRRALFGFGFVFLLMIISLEIIFLFSNRNNGLATSDAGKHYLWTYGPTASEC